MLGTGPGTPESLAGGPCRGLWGRAPITGSLKGDRSMKRSVLVLVAGLLLGGCSSSNIVGTWKAAGDPGEGFSVAEATFRDDGSYSAQVVEGGREMTDTGQ